MKKKKFNELIQKPLRFHHQDIHEELEAIKGMIKDVSYQMQELRESIGRTSVPAQVLSMSQPYVHPWWKHQRPGLEPSGNHYWQQDKATTDDADQTRSRVPGTKKAA